MSALVATAESDSRLIERVAGGDRDAFTELYGRFARPVLAMALRQLGDNGRAEEAAQETFAAIWRSARSYKPERGSASAWLYAVARHAIIDRARQRREPAVEVPEEASGEATPEEQAESSWLTWRVHAALEQLPERERAVLELAYWSGLSQTEIASYLDVPLGHGEDAHAHGAGPSVRPARRGESMKEPVDLRELVGSDLPPEELEELGRVDGLLRSVPAPPHDVPASLTQAVAAVPLKRRPPTRRRLAVAIAFAALIAVAAFGMGRWTADDFSADYSIELQPTSDAPGAAAVVDVGERDPDSGNVELMLQVSGLPKNDGDQFYALWLEKDGEWAATCGYFSVGEGETTVRMTVSYEFRDFDAWNISLGARPDEPPPLLAAEIPEI